MLTFLLVNNSAVLIIIALSSFLPFTRSLYIISSSTSSSSLLLSSFLLVSLLNISLCRHYWLNIFNDTICKCVLYIFFHIPSVRIAYEVLYLLICFCQKLQEKSLPNIHYVDPLTKYMSSYTFFGTHIFSHYVVYFLFEFRSIH